MQSAADRTQDNNTCIVPLASQSLEWGNVNFVIPLQELLQGFSNLCSAILTAFYGRFDGLVWSFTQYTPSSLSTHACRSFALSLFFVALDLSFEAFGGWKARILGGLFGLLLT
jgi:hypothetical protein